MCGRVDAEAVCGEARKFAHSGAIFPTVVAKRLTPKCRPRDFLIRAGPGSAKNRLCRRRV